MHSGDVLACFLLIFYLLDQVLNGVLSLSDKSAVALLLLHNLVLPSAFTMFFVCC